MTWNILHGGGSKRLPAIILELVEQAADVVVVTEYRTTTGGQLRGIMADHGWPHQICSDPPPRSNGVLIASRSPLMAPQSQSRLHIETESPDLGLCVLGLHIPCKGGSTARNSLWKETLAIARRRAHEPCVLIGDFNTGRHFQDEEGATFRQTANLGHLTALGYVDAWRSRFPDRKEASWVSHEGQGFRLDHAFVSASLAHRVTDARYEQRTRKEGLSDHASLSITLCEH
jgi:exodeoxyribonuclease III